MKSWTKLCKKCKRAQMETTWPCTLPTLLRQQLPNGYVQQTTSKWCNNFSASSLETYLFCCCCFDLDFHLSSSNPCRPPSSVNKQWSTSTARLSSRPPTTLTSCTSHQESSVASPFLSCWSSWFRLEWLGSWHCRPLINSREREAILQDNNSFDLCERVAACVYVCCCLSFSVSVFFFHSSLGSIPEYVRNFMRCLKGMALSRSCIAIAG